MRIGMSQLRHIVKCDRLHRSARCASLGALSIFPLQHSSSTTIVHRDGSNDLVRMEADERVCCMTPSCCQIEAGQMPGLLPATVNRAGLTMRSERAPNCAAASEVHEKYTLVSDG